MMTYSEDKNNEWKYFWHIYLEIFFFFTARLDCVGRWVETNFDIPYVLICKSNHSAMYSKFNVYPDLWKNIGLKKMKT